MPSIGVLSSLANTSSAGGQLEHPSEVNSSTTTGTTGAFTVATRGCSSLNVTLTSRCETTLKANTPLNTKRIPNRTFIFTPSVQLVAAQSQSLVFGVSLSRGSTTDAKPFLSRAPIIF